MVWSSAPRNIVSIRPMTTVRISMGQLGQRLALRRAQGICPPCLWRASVSASFCPWRSLRPKAGPGASISVDRAWVLCVLVRRMGQRRCWRDHLANDSSVLGAARHDVRCAGRTHGTRRWSSCFGRLIFRKIDSRKAALFFILPCKGRVVRRTAPKADGGGVSTIRRCRCNCGDCANSYPGSVTLSRIIYPNSYARSFMHFNTLPRQYATR